MSDALIDAFLETVITLICLFIIDYYTLVPGEHTLFGFIRYVTERFEGFKNWFMGQ